MKTLLAYSFLMAALISVSFANPPAGVGGGKGQGNSGFGSITGGSMPPGLQNKGTPPGLQMQNKTPHGWSKGRKEGWKNKHHKSYKHHQIQKD